MITTTNFECNAFASDFLMDTKIQMSSTICIVTNLSEVSSFTTGSNLMVYPKTTFESDGGLTFPFTLHLQIQSPHSENPTNQFIAKE